MRFDTSNNELERPKKVIGLMKDELGGKLMTEFSILRPKTNSYLHKPTIKKKMMRIILEKIINNSSKTINLH